MEVETAGAVRDNKRELLKTKPVDDSTFDILAIDPGIENVGLTYVRLNIADRTAIVMCQKTGPLVGFPTPTPRDTMSLVKAVHRYFSREIRSIIEARVQSDLQFLGRTPALLFVIEDQYIVPGVSMFRGIQLKIIQSSLMALVANAVSNATMFVAKPASVISRLKLPGSKRNSENVRREQFRALYQASFSHDWVADPITPHTADAFLMTVWLALDCFASNQLPVGFSNLGNDKKSILSHNGPAVAASAPVFPDALSSSASTGAAQAPSSKEEIGRSVSVTEDEGAAPDAGRAGLSRSQQVDEAGAVVATEAL